MWIDRRQEYDTTGGYFRRTGFGAERQARGKPVRPMAYSVDEVATMFSVDKRTVYKWLAEADGEAVIPRDGWFRLPGSGYIRIFEWALGPLQEN